MRLRDYHAMVLNLPIAYTACFFATIYLQPVSAAGLTAVFSGQRPICEQTTYWGVKCELDLQTSLIIPNNY